MTAPETKVSPPPPPPTPTPNPYAYTPPRDDSGTIILWARAAVTLFLIPLSRIAFTDEYGAVPFFNDINVSVHEFGHMLFMPFGWEILGHTMMVAGGSLTQVGFPLLFVGYFLFSQKHRDVHGALVCLWWVGINVLDVSIYAGDARAGKLQLINGLTGQDEDSGHDFQYLFRQWGVMNRDTLYAGRLRAIAGMLCFFSIVGGLLWLWVGKPKPTPAVD